MKYRILGKTNLKVSEVGFGCMALGDEAYGLPISAPIPDKVVFKIVKRALELGCNFFDTADNYGKGKSEKRLSEALGKEKDNVIISTKVGKNFYDTKERKKIFTREYIKFALEKSRERLGLDTIPLLQLHGPGEDDIKKGEIFNIIEEMVDKQLVNYYGISANNYNEAILAINTAKENNYNLSTIQVAYNIIDKTPAEELFPLAKSNNFGIIVRGALCRGFLTGKYGLNSDFSEGAIKKFLELYDLKNILENVERVKAILATNDPEALCKLSLKFILENQSVSTVIPGIKNLQQVDTNLTASDESSLSETELSELNKIPNLKKKMKTKETL